MCALLRNFIENFEWSVLVDTSFGCDPAGTAHQLLQTAGSNLRLSLKPVELLGLFALVPAEQSGRPRAQQLQQLGPWPTRTTSPLSLPPCPHRCNDSKGHVVAVVTDSVLQGHAVCHCTDTG